jgi:hypothetical protein
MHYTTNQGSPPRNTTADTPLFPSTLPTRRRKQTTNPAAPKDTTTLYR